MADADADAGGQRGAMQKGVGAANANWWPCFCKSCQVNAIYKSAEAAARVNLIKKLISFEFFFFFIFAKFSMQMRLHLMQFHFNSSCVCVWVLDVCVV